MAMISYAQNYEDVMLWRALKHVKKGFYIDIGAAWPEDDSVTAHFYKNGWSGLNVEPNSELFRQLQEKRSRDLNVNCAVGNYVGKTEISILENAGLSTLDTEIADQHYKNYGYSARNLKVELTTLNALYGDYISGDQPVHFLKVDVEGAEKQVLEGNDWTQNRPWIVLVEATQPMSQDVSYKEWESTLLDGNYIFVYFDGLNRFYIAEERHEELHSAFLTPPNFFDAFKHISHHQAEQDLIAYVENANKVENWAEELEKRAEEVSVWSEKVESRAESFKLWSEKLELKEQRLDVEFRSAEVRVQEAEVHVQEAEVHVQEAEVHVQEAEVRVQEAEVRVQKLQYSEQVLVAQVNDSQLKLNESNAQLEAALNKAHEWWIEAENRQQYAQALLKSSSWRISAPLRVLRRFQIRAYKLIKGFLKAVIRPVLIKALRLLIDQRGLFIKLSALTKRYPNLHAHLKFFASHHGLISIEQADYYHQQAKVKSNNKSMADTNRVQISLMSPRASDVFQKLKKEIEG